MEWLMSSSVRLQFARKSSPVPKYWWWGGSDPHFATLLFFAPTGCQRTPFQSSNFKLWGYWWMAGKEDWVHNIARGCLSGLAPLNRDVKWAGTHSRPGPARDISGLGWPCLMMGWGRTRARPKQNPIQTGRGRRLIGPSLLILRAVGLRSHMGSQYFLRAVGLSSFKFGLETWPALAWN